MLGQHARAPRRSWWTPLLLAQRRLLTWLRGSLRRWFVAPVAATTLLLAVVGTVAGCALVRTVTERAETQRLASAAEIALSALQKEARTLGSATSGLAGVEMVDLPLAGGDTTALRLQVGRSARLLGLDAVAVINAGAGAGGGLHLDMLAEWNAGLLFDTSVFGAFEQRLASSDPQDGSSAVGLTRGRNQGVLYALSRVAGAGPSPTFLLTGSYLSRVLQPADAAFPGRLVCYDTQGKPVLSTLPGGTEGLTDLSLSVLSDSTRASGGERVYPTSLAGEPYLMALRPVVWEQETVGYVAAWQSVYEVMARTRSIQGIFILVLGLTAAAILLAHFRLAGWAVQPVLAMLDVAVELAEGRPTPPMPESMVGELNVLANTLQDMSERVRQQREVLLEQARQSTYLFEASAELGRTLNLDESVQTAAEAIYGLGGIRYVVLLVGRGELGPYVGAAARGLSQEVTARLLGREYSVPLWGVMAHALVSRKPLVIDDVVAQNRPRPGEFEWEVCQGSMLLFPVNSASGPFALIILGADEPGAFSKGSLGDTAFALARIATQSIQNAQLYQQAMRSQEQLITLQVISKLMASAQPIESVLEVVLREASELSGNSQAWVLLGDPGCGNYQLHSCSQPSPAHPWTQVHEDAAAWAMRAGQPVFFSPQHPLPPSPILVDAGPALCVPLEVRDGYLGALVVVSRRAGHFFVEEDMIVMRTLANGTAATLSAAKARPGGP